MLAIAIAALLCPQSPPSFAELGREHIPEARSFRALAVADLDGDGADDLIGVDPTAVVRLLRNDGHGLFDDVSSRLPAGTRALSIATGDIDGDGTRDLVVGTGASATRSGIRVFRNRGVFVEIPGAVSGVARAMTLDLCDYDVDGDLDILFVGGAEARMLLNDGSGTFTAAAQPLPLVTTAFLRRDVDLDGDCDLLVQVANTSGAILLNDGSGSFSTHASVPMPGTHGTRFGDVDGDGDPDLVVGYVLASRLRREVLLNDGTGTFRSAGSRGLPSSTDLLEARCLLADVDGDPTVDFVRLSGSTSEVWTNDGTGHFTRSTSALPIDNGAPRDLIAADLDGDRDLDLATVGTHCELLFRVTSGSFTNATASNPTRVLSSLTSRASFGDLDGDAFVDLVVANGGPASLSRNRGDGCLEHDHAASTTFGDEVRDVAMLDHDGDGDLDLATASGRTVMQQLRLFRNDGGSFTDVTLSAMPYFADRWGRVVAGDLDGDGDPDLAFLGDQTAVPVVVLNQGGVFTAGPTVPGLAAPPLDLEPGDMDGDGDLDLLLGNGLLLNDGTGAFRDASARLPAITAEVGGFVPFDADGDGDLDVYLALTNAPAGGAQDVLLENRGGTFTDVTAARLPAVTDDSRFVRAADLDGDGDQDLVVGVFGDDKVLLNDGTGRFRVAGVSLPRTGGRGTRAIADVDADGDLDLLHGGHVLRNLRVQLSTPHLPRVGTSWTLRAHGLGSRGFAGILVSPRTASVQVPGVGRLGVDLGVGAYVGSTTTGDPGTLVLPVPPSTALIGAPIFAQALVVRPDGGGITLRLTNVTADLIH